MESIFYKSVNPGSALYFKTRISRLVSEKRSNLSKRRLCHDSCLWETTTWALIIITEFSSVYNYNIKCYSIMTVYTECSYAECDADCRYIVAFNDPLKENVWNVIFSFQFCCSNWNKLDLNRRKKGINISSYFNLFFVNSFNLSFQPSGFYDSFSWSWRAGPDVLNLFTAVNYKWS